MFERLQKPFLTVETGEAYQPIRLTYSLHHKDKLAETLSQLGCLEKKSSTNWNWFWKDECDDIHFESLDSFQKNPTHPVRLGSFSIRNQKLYLTLPSFKRACLAVPFFHRVINSEVANIHKADFLNKVFAIDERLPHGFTELFKENELEKLIQQRLNDYEKVKTKVEDAETAEEAFTLLKDYTETEAKKRLPYAERYLFEYSNAEDADVVFLSFYIFLRGRELVAIRRWYGETNYTFSDAIEEAVDRVFGGMNIDIIE